MIDQAIKRLTYLCDKIPPLLEAVPEKDFSEKAGRDKWSKKEILGHLIDSASNNHQRFVRVQFEPMPVISYDQNLWNSHSHYNDLDKSHLVKFWALYNRHLVEILKRIPQENLNHLTKTHDDTPAVTLEFIINDYVRHLEHHLKQLVHYND